MLIYNIYSMPSMSQAGFLTLYLYVHLSYVIFTKIMTAGN
jgi:hypothetical protein